MRFFSLIFIISILTLSVQFNPRLCKLPNDLIKEIKSYQKMVNYIIRIATTERYAGKFHRDLTEFIDKYGSRMSGTSNLEDAIDYIKNKAVLEGLSTHKEPVLVPTWTRMAESATLLEPRKKSLRIVALGFSLPTIPSGLVSKLIVVSDFTELRNKEKLIKGKIVLINFSPSKYENDLNYQYKCAEKALEVKALAVLIRSVPRSGCNPHTGRINYESGKLLPAAAISHEDSALLARLYKKHTLLIHLIIQTIPGAPAISNNLIFDYKGSTHPDELITISGHIDSWDLGQGALDNAAGAFLALHTILLLKFLKIEPKRTIRGIMWTGKEQGMLGSKSYMLAHATEVAKNWTIALSSDEGLYEPRALTYHGPIYAFCMIKEIMLLFKEYYPNLKLEHEKLNLRGDINIFRKVGVPVMEPITNPEYHFSRIHSVNDDIENLDSKQIDRNLGIFGGLVYVLSNLSKKLPKDWEIFRSLKERLLDILGIQF